MLKRLLISIPLWFVLSFTCKGQDIVFTQIAEFKFQNIRIGHLIDSLSIIYGIDFAYDAGIIKIDSIVNVDAKGEILGDWINSYFKNSKRDVSFTDRQVIIGRPRGVFIPRESLRISGKIEIYGTNRPLPFANIGVIDHPIGTTSNEQGNFEIILPITYSGEKLSISHLGFLSRKISIPRSDTTIHVSLAETTVHLPEVQIKYMNPIHILQNMVDRIPANYPTDTYFLTAFFRETIKQDGRYVDVSEAIVEILKPSYQTSFDYEKARFIKGRKGKELSEMDIVNFKLEGGPYHFSRLDVVRHRDFVNLNNEAGFYNYYFEGLGIEHDRLVYKVRFKPKDDSEDLFYQGELRIDSETYALVSAIFELTPPSIRRSRNYLIKRDARRFITKPYLARYYVDYRPWGNIWILNKVRGEVSLRITDKSNKQRSDIQTISEILVSDLVKAESRQKHKWFGTFKADYILSDNIGDFDPDFWKNFNIISPDEALEKVFSGK